jgi:hypothetical protein
MWRIIGLLGSALCASVLLYGCAQPTGPGDQTAAIKSLESEVKMLSSYADTLAAQSANALQRIAALETSQQIQQSYTSAVLDPAQTIYLRLDANVGTFGVSLSDVHPFADGVKIRLNLGNLSSAAFGGATLQLKYGRRAPPYSDPDFASKTQAWSKSLRNKQETVIARLLPGHWNPVQIVLPGIDAKDFGYLEVSMSTNMIYMY